MILFTKEVFLQVKNINNMHINAQINMQNPNQPTYIWQVYLQGTSVDNDPQDMGLNDVQIYLNCDSKKDAYRLFSELAKQIVDSGTMPELNSKLLDDVLKGEVNDQ